MNALKTKKKVRKLRRGDQLFGTAMASIPLWGWLFFGAFPFVVSAILSFAELHTTEINEIQFVGLENFITILTNADNYTYGSYITSGLYMLIYPVASIALSMWVAYMINRTKIGKRFFRSVFFIPYVCSSVVITLTFKMFLYNDEIGLLRTLFDALGFEHVRWLTSSPWLFMLSVILMDLWGSMGYKVLLFQAALANVDQTYYEAATLDGANERQKFWGITIKAISPTTGYMLTMDLIGSLQAMESFMLLSSAALTPSWGDFTQGWVSDTVTKHIYNMIFVRSYMHGYGLASAAGWILAIITLIITRINMKAQEKWVCYDF